MSKPDNSCFDFLKGNDAGFDSAMKSIDSMYTNLFSDEKLNDIFKNISVDNSPITQPISDMSNEIFKTEPTKGPVYVKVPDSSVQNQDDEEDFIIGQPVQPYLQQADYRVKPNRGQEEEPMGRHKNLYSNPYYQ